MKSLLLLLVGVSKCDEIIVDSCEACDTCDSSDEVMLMGPSMNGLLGDRIMALLGVAPDGESRLLSTVRLETGAHVVSQVAKVTSETGLRAAGRGRGRGTGCDVVIEAAGEFESDLALGLLIGLPAGE